MRRQTGFLLIPLIKMPSYPHRLIAGEKAVRAEAVISARIDPTALADLAEVRALYHRSRRVHEAVAGGKGIPWQQLRLAVQELSGS
mgnify:CR=1 FL=1